MTRLPPSWATRFATSDLDEIRALFEPYGSHHRQCVGRGPLDVRWSWVVLGSATIGWGESNLGQRLRATPREMLLHVPLHGAATYRVGQRYLEALPGRAVLVRAGTDYSISYSAATRVFAASLRESELLGFLSSLGVARGEGLPAALELGFPAEALGQFTASLEPLWGQSAIAPESPLAHHLQGRLTAWIASLAAPHLASTPQGKLAEARIRRVEDWIDAHFSEAIDLAALCRVAGIEARGLRKSFQQRRGMSPMEWVWSRRMAAARSRLLAAAPGESVIHIAHDQGIAHPGRFAVDYRRRYGESPSVTLAAAQGRG
jgi:AraC-like DNA-binding protein